MLTDASDGVGLSNRARYELCRVLIKQGKVSPEDIPHILPLLKKEGLHLLRSLEIFAHSAMRFFIGGDTWVFTRSEIEHIQRSYKSLSVDTRLQLVRAYEQYTSEENGSHEKEQFRQSAKRIREYATQIAKKLAEKGYLSERKVNQLTGAECLTLCNIAQSYRNVEFTQYPELFSKDYLIGKRSIVIQAIEGVRINAQAVADEAFLLGQQRQLLTRSIQGLLHYITDLQTIVGTEAIQANILAASEVVDEVIRSVRPMLGVQKEMGGSIADRLNHYLEEKEEQYYRSMDTFVERRIWPILSGYGIEGKQIIGLRDAISTKKNASVDGKRNRLEEKIPRRLVDSLVRVYTCLLQTRGERDDYISESSDAILQLLYDLVIHEKSVHI